MRAINLIPAEAGRHGLGSPSLGRVGPIHVVIGLLGLALIYVTVYVMTTNTISQRTSRLASLRAEIARDQAQINELNEYVQFEQLAQTRANAVKQIVTTRFDWHAALTDLSKVLPANTTLQSLVGNVTSPTSSGASSAASAAAGTSGGPSFELKGCTATQDDVARVMSRLRLINGVSGVTLNDSSKAAGGSSGTAVSASAAGGCPGNGPAFDLVVSFQSPGVAAAGTGSASLPASTSTGAPK